MTNRPPDITGSSLAIETLAVELALDLAVSARVEQLAIPARAVVVAAGPDHVAELCVNERRLLEGKVLELVEVLWRLSQLGAAGPTTSCGRRLSEKFSASNKWMWPETFSFTFDERICPTAFCSMKLSTVFCFLAIRMPLNVKWVASQAFRGIEPLIAL